MTVRRCAVPIVAALIVALATITPAAANLLTNGSFETGPGGYLAVGSAAIAPWAVVSGDLDQIAGLWPGAGADFSLDMNGFGPGAIEQTFATIPGQAYALTFQLGANGTGTKTLRVSAAGTTQDFSYENVSFPADPVGWTGRTFVFVATGTSTTLGLASLTGGAGGPTLDAVDVEAVPSTSLITTVAGTGAAGYSGDGGQAVLAQLNTAHGVAVDVARNFLYIGDQASNRVRQVDLATGIITTVAGTGAAGYAGDGGQATAAAIGSPYGVDVDAVGNLYIASTFAHRVLKVDIVTGVVTLVAGNGAPGFGGDGGAATAADLNGPTDVALDGQNLYIADWSNDRIRKVDLVSGIITTIAGDGTPGFGDGALPGIVNHGISVDVDAQGNIYVADFSHRVRKIDPIANTITTIAGDGTAGVDDGLLPGRLNQPRGVVIDTQNNVYVSDYGNHRVRKIDPIAGTITTVAGTGSGASTGDGGPATSAGVNRPSGLAFDGQGSLYVSEHTGNRVRMVESILTVSAPDVEATYNQKLTIPISISEASGVVSAEVTVEYDPALLTFVNVDGTGTLSDPGPPDQWAVEYNTEPGTGALERVRIATAVSQSAATGPQALINVSFTVGDQPRVPGSSPLALLNVLLNDGTPANTTVNGSVTLVGNDATITSLPPTFYPRENLTVTVVDLDEDTDGLANTDQVSVTATNLNNGDVANLTLSEDAITKGTFHVVVSTEFGLAAVVDGILQAQRDDVIEFAFDEALDASGAGPITRTAQSLAIGGVDGTVEITRATQPGDVIYVRVEDADLNTSDGVQETAQVVVTSSNGESETVTVTESDLDDEVFFGSLSSTAGASAGTDDDGTINGAKSDVLTATYDDVVTYLGDQLDRTDTDQVVDPFGDADGNTQVQAFDAAQVLLHVLVPHITGLELLQGNVDLNPVATGITPFDASLILQKRVGLIAVFPVQTAPSDNHPQSTPASPKVVPDARMLALTAGDGYLALTADERSGMLSGDLVFSGVERVELAPELGEYLIAQRVIDGDLRVVFAGPRAVDGAGEMLRLYGVDLSRARLESASLNDGALTAQVTNSSLQVHPTATSLLGNWPNPFNPETVIRFDLAQAGDVRLEVFNAAGQRVSTLVSESLPAGAHQVMWRGADESGRAVSSGVYFYRLQAGDQKQMQQMLLLR